MIDTHAIAQRLALESTHIIARLYFVSYIASPQDFVFGRRVHFDRAWSDEPEHATLEVYARR